MGKTKGFDWVKEWENSRCFWAMVDLEKHSKVYFIKEARRSWFEEISRREKEIRKRGEI